MPVANGTEPSGYRFGPNTSHEWVYVTGRAEVYWAEETNGIPDGDIRPLDTTPVVGRTYVIWEATTIHSETPCWVIFVPADSFINGWFAYPEEVTRSALVLVEYMETLGQREHGEWIKIGVRDVIPFRDIAKRFPESHSGAFTQLLSGHAHIYEERFGDLTYIREISEADRRILCQETSQGFRLLLFAHDGVIPSFWAGNRLLKPKEWQERRSRAS